MNCVRHALASLLKRRGMSSQVRSPSLKAIKYKSNQVIATAKAVWA
nr:hypothetical protein [Nostoc sp. CHAB 5715]